MLKNYLKLAWRVLFRRKFFTFISLFGISFTLMALMLFTSAYQTEMGSKAPFSQQDDMVQLSLIELRQQFYDTIPVVDSTLIGGVMQYDTTGVKHESEGMSQSTNAFSRALLENYFSDLEECKIATIYSNSPQYDVFKNNTKINIDANYVDAAFWQVFDFSFIEGKPFSDLDFEQEAQKAVISESLAFKYFGKEKGVIGEEIEIDGRNYKVIGVVQQPKMSFSAVQQDVFIPYTAFPILPGEDFYHGRFRGMFIAKNGIDKLKKEIIYRTSQLPMDRKDGFNEVIIWPGGVKEKYAQSLFYEENPEDSYRTMRLIVIGLLSLFVLLPTLNLINLNVTRILDRSSEIGVRKAFGAHQGNIIFQFIFENIILTLLGGVLGFVLYFILMNIINSAHLLGKAQLVADLKFGAYAFLITLLFGILSGLLPAYRMAKTQIVNALKRNQL